MRVKLAVFLAILVALFLAADRIAVRVAEHRIAGIVQTDAHLARRPHVSIHGFPFLLQAARGRYPRIDVRASDVFAADPAAAADGSLAQLSFRGVRLPLSKALSGHVDRVFVDRVAGTVEIPFSDIAAAAPVAGLSIGPVAGRSDALALGESVDIAGAPAEFEAVAKVALAAGRLAVTPETVRGPDGEAASGSVLAAVRANASFTVRVPALPGGVSLSGVSVDGAGVVVTVSGTRVDLQP